MGPDAMILVFWMWVFSQLFHLLFHFHQEALWFFFTLCHKGGVICISEVIDISPGNLDTRLCFIQPRISHDVLWISKVIIYSFAYSFPDLETVCCSMSSSYCYFLICIQIPQEAGQVVRFSHLLKSFPQFTVIHTVKGFGIVNKAEIDVFLELSCLFNDPTDVGNLISGSSAFSKFSLCIGSSWFTNCWSLVWRILSITLLACKISAVVF